MTKGIPKLHTSITNKLAKLLTKSSTNLDLKTPAKCYRVLYVHNIIISGLVQQNVNLT